MPGLITDVVTKRQVFIYLEYISLESVLEREQNRERERESTLKIANFGCISVTYFVRLSPFN